MFQWDECMITSLSFHCSIFLGPTWFVPLLHCVTNKAKASFGNPQGPYSWTPNHKRCKNEFPKIQQQSIRTPGKTHPEWTILLVLTNTLCRFLLQQTESHYLSEVDLYVVLIAVKAMTRNFAWLGAASSQCIRVPRFTHGKCSLTRILKEWEDRASKRY